MINLTAWLLVRKRTIPTERPPRKGKNIDYNTYIVISFTVKMHFLKYFHILVVRDESLRQ
jgi:hypothetical protein